MFLLIYNPPTNSPYRIKADSLIDCISSYFNEDLVSSNSFTILDDINLVDVCWATITAHPDYSKAILEKVGSLNLLPLVFEPTYKSESILDIILTSTPELFTVCVDDSLYSDHFAVFAWFSLPKPLSNQSSQTTSKLSASSFSTYCFNRNLSFRYYDLLSFPNSSFLQFSFDDYVAFWYQVLMNAINASSHRKTNRRLEFAYFYSSHSIHMNNKLRTAAKNSYEPTYLQLDVNVPSFSVYFDFSKAFDLVFHHKLPQKLASFNFDSDFSVLFKSYLNQRSQKVFVNGCLSDSAKITSGVPQGSVLGPLLFPILINDLPKTVRTSSSYLIADDS